MLGQLSEGVQPGAVIDSARRRNRVFAGTEK